MQNEPNFRRAERLPSPSPGMAGLRRRVPGVFPDTPPFHYSIIPPFQSDANRAKRTQLLDCGLAGSQTGVTTLRIGDKPAARGPPGRLCKTKPIPAVPGGARPVGRAGISYKQTQFRRPRNPATIPLFHPSSGDGACRVGRAPAGRGSCQQSRFGETGAGPIHPPKAIRRVGRGPGDEGRRWGTCGVVQTKPIAWGHAKRQVLCGKRVMVNWTGKRLRRNKPNSRRCRAGRGLRDAGRGSCTNEPNFRRAGSLGPVHRAKQDSPVGKPRGEIRTQFAGPIRRIPAILIFSVRPFPWPRRAKCAKRTQFGQGSAFQGSAN